MEHTERSAALFGRGGLWQRRQLAGQHTKALALAALEVCEPVAGLRSASERFWEFWGELAGGAKTLGLAGAGAFRVGNLVCLAGRCCRRKPRPRAVMRDVGGPERCAEAGVLQAVRL